MKNTLILFTMLNIAAINVIAQTQPAGEMKIPYIELTGVAEREITPDEIYIKITIKERLAGKEKITIESQEEKMKTAFKESGLDLSNLYLADISAGVVWVRRKTKDVLTQKDYTLKVNNAAMVGKVFQKLDDLQIDDASISKVDHSGMDSIRKEVRILAIKAARAKADYLLGAIGEQTGKPWVIMEVTDQPIFYMNENQVTNNFYNNTSVPASLRELKETELQFKNISVRSAIYVKFAIK